ncbi:Cytosolic iron-sulfur protein assembly protein [Diatrype stigma]|uniref:Probable cytosolic iron-sulfur protein assembly protein 1 n=1 Tax=Diatrype stigma TaxID=117547 RepID=A0AAN9UF03_9PEZI
MASSEPGEPGATTTTDGAATTTTNKTLKLSPLPVFKPDLYERAWQSIPHPTLPLLATAHQKSVTVFSLSTLSAHSTLTGGHSRSVRSVAWKPNLGPHQLCLVTGSFDSMAGLWRWEGDQPERSDDDDGGDGNLEVEVTASGARQVGSDDDDDGDGIGGAAASSSGEKEWEFTLVLEGHDSEIKSVAFSPAGQYLATCSRDKSVWIWEDVGATEADDEWETVAVLNEHEGDVKAVAWCPDFQSANSSNGNNNDDGGSRRKKNTRYSSDALASASYDNTVRVWREDDEGEWVCVAVLEGHQGTVWGLQWEPRPRGPGLFPRLLTWSADRTVRIWTLHEEEEDGEGEGGEAAPRQHAWSGLGNIPNTMRRSLREDWECTATLPQVHTRDIYSVAWSAETGLVASTGSDGVIALYREEEGGEDSATGGGGSDSKHMTDDEAAAAELDGDVPMTNGHPETQGNKTRWVLLSTTPNAHGPYEINHVTWCKRYDAGCPPERRGRDEMLVTTGDEGIIRPWEVLQQP